MAVTRSLHRSYNPHPLAPLRSITDDRERARWCHRPNRRSIYVCTAAERVYSGGFFPLLVGDTRFEGYAMPESVLKAPPYASRNKL
jgi:hypothetical protein